MTVQYNIGIARRSVELCQLAGRWNDATPMQDMIVEAKLDGFRGIWFRGLDGKARLWTRNGHPIEGTGHIAHVLIVMERLAGENMFFDGEFIVGNTLAETKAWWQTGWKSDGEAGTLHLFDAMPEREWRNGGCDMPLIDRKARLQALHDAALDYIANDWDWREGTRGKEPDSEPTTVLSHSIVGGVRGVHILANEVWSQNGEGVMIKDPTAAYTRGRNRAWLKLKRGY